MPSSSTRFGVSSSSSLSPQARTKAHQTDASSSASILASRRSSRSATADLLDQLGEEAADDQAAGLVGRDAAGLR